MVQFCDGRHRRPMGGEAPAGGLPMVETGRCHHRSPNPRQLFASFSSYSSSSCSSCFSCFIDLPALIQSDGTATDLSFGPSIVVQCCWQNYTYTTPQIRWCQIRWSTISSWCTAVTGINDHLNQPELMLGLDTGYTNVSHMLQYIHRSGHMLDLQYIHRSAAAGAAGLLLLLLYRSVLIQSKATVHQPP